MNHRWSAHGALVTSLLVVACSDQGSPRASFDGGSDGITAGGDTVVPEKPPGGTTAPVIPVKKSASEYDLTLGTDVVFAVNPQMGGRVTAMSLGGTNVIVGSGSSTTNYGSTFWTSPQSAWDGNPATLRDWPPPTAIDSDPYTATISDAHLVLAGPSYSTLGISITKDFSADAVTGWVRLQYTINASQDVQAAPWEVTRVPRGGIAFFMAAAGATYSAGPLTVTQSGGAMWWDDTAGTASSPNGTKLIADSAGGWLAYARGGVLFLKRFPDIPAALFAPGEGDTEIYPGSGYSELEVQGAYGSIAAGTQLTWTTAWRVAPIPSSVTVSAGSATLLAFAQDQAAR